MPTNRSGRAKQQLLDDRIEPFLQQLRAAGYVERALRRKRTVLRAFARWVERKGIAACDLGECHLDAFTARPPQKRKSHAKFELAVMRLFFRYLRTNAGLQLPHPRAPQSFTASLLQEYENHLRKDRGLADNSLRVYLPLIRSFLASKRANSGFPQSLKALEIRDFIVAQTRNWSAEYVRLLSVALRSFCLFLFLSGQMPVDLAASVLRVCKYRQSAPPAFLSPEQVTRALASSNRPIQAGRRNRRPWKGSHCRALTAAAGYWPSVDRLPSQRSRRQPIPANLPTTAGTAYRTGRAGGGR